VKRARHSCPDCDASRPPRRELPLWAVTTLGLLVLAAAVAAMLAAAKGP
jgi:hypothetical protein